MYVLQSLKGQQPRRSVVNKRRMRVRWHDAWNVCRTSVMNNAMNSMMRYRWRIVCGIGNDCNISTSLACGGHLAAINDFSTGVNYV
jgi:hypothetical protein